MIYIEKNSNNYLYLTLSESTDKTNFLFRFDFDGYTNKDNPIFYYTDDLSSYKNRYNKFLLIDNDDTGAFASTASISPTYSGTFNMKAGQYVYAVYALDNYTDLANAISSVDTDDIVEIGRMVVNGIDENLDPRYR